MYMVENLEKTSVINWINIIFKASNVILKKIIINVGPLYSKYFNF